MSNTNEEKKLIVQNIFKQLIEHYELQGIDGLAKFLDVKYSTLKGWERRGNIADIEPFLFKCQHINPSWLKTGEGKMFASSGGIGVACGIVNTSSGIGVSGGTTHVPATGVAEQKKPPEILFAEGLLPQLTPDDLNEVIGDMLGRIKKAKNRATDPLFDLLPDNKPLAIAKLQEQIRMLEDPEGELSQTPVAKPATER